MSSVNRQSVGTCRTSKWAAVLILWLLLSTAVLGFVHLQPTQTPGSNGNPQYTIAVNVRLVVLPVTVTNHKGLGVPDLRAQDFRVYEDGHLQKIALFKHEDVPVTVGLVVDNSSSMLPKRPEVKEAALAFAQSSNPQDEMFVVNFSGAPHFGLPHNVLFTDQAALLSQSLSPAPGGRTALYDAIALALNRLQRGTKPKKALIIVSDGGDNASHYRLRQVLHMAETSNALIYTVGLLDQNEMDQNPRVLQQIAKETGGEAYFPNTLTRVATIFQELARDLRQQYTIGYVPPNPGNEKNYRKVRVHVVARGRGKFRVRTRSGYYMPAAKPHHSISQGNTT